MSGESSASAAVGLHGTVLRLQEFWAARGCQLLPPCDFAVPFAGLHPDAFFGVLGAGAWRASCLQPVRRPLDSRYGEHPYRLGKHLQLLVVLKPPPADVQRLYFESLEAAGLDLPLHDLRFIEADWTTRSLGSFGSGWHALLDGLGVTRLNFLDRLADRPLDPACVEITYGVERLVMTLQGAASAFKVAWSDDGAVDSRPRRRQEEELSRYALEVADPGRLRGRLEMLDGEAERCLAADLARTAYELAVRCLESIDLLEARGELSARERGDWLDRVRGRVVAAVELASKAPPETPPPAAAPAKGVAKRPKQRRAKKSPRKKRGAAKRGARGQAGETPDEPTDGGADGE